jgi:hypothetical protein
MRARIHPSPRRGVSPAVSVTVDSDAHPHRTKFSITRVPKGRVVPGNIDGTGTGLAAPNTESSLSRPPSQLVLFRRRMPHAPQR